MLIVLYSNRKHLNNNLLALNLSSRKRTQPLTL